MDIYLETFSFLSTDFMYTETSSYLFYEMFLSCEQLSFRSGGFLLTRIFAFLGNYQWRITLMEVVHHRTIRLIVARSLVIGYLIESHGTFSSQIGIELFRSRSSNRIRSTMTLLRFSVHETKRFTFFA